MTVSEDGELVRGCLAGEAGFLRAFVDRYQSAVFGLCLRMLGHRHDAEDVSQEVFLRAFRGLRKWDPGRPLKPWLLTIAANRCRTWLARRKTRDLPSEFGADVCDPRTTGSSLHLAEELQKALENLREEYRLCFVLYHQNELSLAEIAQIVESPEGTVKTWLHRARKELAAHLQRKGFAPQAGHELH
ncbi:MAG: RNA polymerase sigma factor [Planctomycetaceae bacterium]